MLRVGSSVASRGGRSGSRCARRWRTYTSTPAWQDHAEDWKGTLERGRVADVGVVDGDVLETRPAKLTDLEVTATILGGKVVSERRRGTLAAAAAAAGGTGITREDADFARACLHAGSCCCTAADDLLLAGRL